MNFFLKYKNILARFLLIVFVVSAVAVPVGTAFAYTAEQYADANPGTQGAFEAAMAGLNNDKAPDTGCFSLSLDNKFLGCSALLSYYWFSFTYWLAGWLSLFFNFSLNYFVMGMGQLFAEMDGIMVAWKTVRDVANVFLVFLTVYIGIATILGISGYGAKQLLWKVVLAALLVNFSVTFTKVVIDISNATAIQIYTMFEQEISPGANCTQRVNPAASDNNPCITKAIAGAFWSQLQITTLFDATKLSEGLTGAGNVAAVYQKMIVTFLMGSVMFIVLAFVFGGAGILLLARFVILVFLLILSPIALVLWVTGVSSQGRAWWSKLLSQSFFPPAILLCWWLAFVILRSYNERIVGSLSDGVLVSTSGISIVSMFVVVMSFLVAGLILASKMGAYGAKAILKTGEGWSRAAAGGMTLGLGAYALRQTVGRGAAYATNSDKLKDGAASRNFFTRNMSKAALAASKKTAGSSFDGRALTNSKFAGSAGGKGGFNAWTTNKAKKEEELNKELSTYKGTAAEQAAHADKLHEVNREANEKTRLAQSKAQERIDLAQNIQNPQAREAAIKGAESLLKQSLDKVEQARIATRNALADSTQKAYDEKGKQRSEKNLDRLSTEKTLGVFNTPQWKKDAVAKMRKEGGKSKMQRAIEVIVEENKPEGAPPAAAPTPPTPPTPPATS